MKEMKIEVPNIFSPRFFLWFAFILSIFIETLISMEIIPDNDNVKLIQYIIILTPIAINLTGLMHKRKTLFADEMKSGIVLITLLGIMSLYRSFQAGRFSAGSIMHLVQIILPFLFAYLMVNLFTPKEIDEFMVFALACTWAGYIAEVGIDTFFSLSNYFTISFGASRSAFENSTYAELASGLGAYFIYNYRRRPVPAVVALILNILIFKRVLLLMAVFLFITCLFHKENDLIRRGTVIIAGVAWCVLIFLAYYLYQPANAQMLQENTGIDLAEFSMFRIWRLWVLFDADFVSYGLNSANEFLISNAGYLGGDMEMDFVRIMFELGPLAIICIVYTYLKIIRRNKYSFVLICFCFLNLLMANGIVRYWGYAMRLITIALISNYDRNMNRKEPVAYKASYRKGGQGIDG